jgi:hypothetical protein
LLIECFASTYWFVRFLAGVEDAAVESIVFSVAGLQTDKSSLYFPPAPEVPEVVTFDEQPKTKSAKQLNRVNEVRMIIQL